MTWHLYVMQVLLVVYFNVVATSLACVCQCGAAVWSQDLLYTHTSTYRTDSRSVGHCSLCASVRLVFGSILIYTSAANLTSTRMHRMDDCTFGTGLTWCVFFFFQVKMFNTYIIKLSDLFLEYIYLLTFSIVDIPGILDHSKDCL